MREAMPEQREVSITNLLLDLENPRLAEGQQTQPHTIQAMLRAEGPKTLTLAKSIAGEGLSPIERLLVMPSADNAKRLIVLEGNRRVTALKILAEPTLAEPALTAPQMKRLRKWSAQYRNRGEIERVPCTIFASRDEASQWIERRHRGDQGGAGIVRWGATEAARFDARRRGKSPPELQVLDYIAEHASLDANTREKLSNVSITNLKRLVADESVRRALGLRLEGGVLSTSYSDEETVKGLTRIVRDLANDQLKVTDIYTAADRRRYIAGFEAHERPSAAKQLSEMRPLISEGPPASGGASRGDKRETQGRYRGPRKTTIPASCSLSLKNARLSNIYRELRRLHVEEYPNAISVLLRVFVELSADLAIEKANLMPAQQLQHSKLRIKLSSLADHLEQSGRLTNAQAKAVRKAGTDDRFLASNVVTLHLYVHNPYVSPSATDLRAAWDDLQPFFEALCH
jgi:hypothetical protein